MGRPENLCQSPEFTAEMIGDIVKEEAERALRLNTILNILGDDYDLDRLHELVKADRDKRCVIFKFGLGSTVYRVWVRPDGSHPFVSAENMSTVNDLVNAESWTDSYASREAAEAEVAALKRRFADGQGTQKG